MPTPFVVLLAACQQTGPWARAVRIEDHSETIGGPKGLAQPGDFLIENDRVRFSLLDARTSMGPHTSGGSLVDADLQRNDPRYLGGNGKDALSEVFPTVSLNVQQTDEDGGSVEIVADGSDGGAAVVCTEGPEESFITLMDGLWGFLGWPADSNYRMRTDYTLEPGSGALHMRTYAIFGDDSGCRAELDAVPADTSDDSLPLLELSLETGLTLGDFYLQGGSVDVFAPDVGFDEETYVYALTEAGANTFTEPIRVDYVGGTADGVSYGLIAAEGSLFVPMFTASQTVAIGAGVEGSGEGNRFDPGAAFSYDRWFAVGRGDMGSVVDALLEARGDEVGRVEGWVLEKGTGVALSGVHVFAYREGAEHPWSEWRTDVGDDPHPDGSFAGTLPPGDWEVLVHAAGRPDGPRVPLRVSKGKTSRLVLESPQPGSVRFSIVDETGARVPAKLSVFAADGDSPRDPVLGDGYVAGNPAAVVFSADGTGQIALPPGRYVAMASRGVEYELDVTDPFEVSAKSAIELDLQVIRSVDTTGWVSADLHVHAVPSQDSGITLSDRVTTMAAEGVEFLSSTDHDRLTDYRPVIRDLGLGPWVSSTVGLEVTTIEIGHFLGFPLVYDPMADAGGALDWDGLEPQDIIDGLRDLGDPAQDDPVVFVGHPRDGILGYFDQYGVNPYVANGDSLEVDPGLLAINNDLLREAAYSDEFDAMEVLNAKRFELIRTPTAPEVEDAYEGTASAYGILERTAAEQADLESGVYTLGYGIRGQVDDWFSLLNLGYRYTAIGNSDTHGKSSVEAGCPRNFVMAETDDPAFLDEGEIARAVREGRVVTSYGPFVRFYAGDESHGPGSDVGGPADLTIEVSSPSWFSVNRVELYENGRLLQEWTEPGVDAYGPVNLSETVPVSPEVDSWYVVIAMGEDDLAPVFTEVEIPPVQLQDVVYDALSGVGLSSMLSAAVPVPRAFPIYPFALTNPIWVDADGDGAFTPPGLPAWLVEPAAPEE